MTFTTMLTFVAFSVALCPALGERLNLLRIDSTSLADNNKPKWVGSHEFGRSLFFSGETSLSFRELFDVIVGGGSMSMISMSMSMGYGYPPNDPSPVSPPPATTTTSPPPVVPITTADPIDTVTSVPSVPVDTMNNTGNPDSDSPATTMAPTNGGTTGTANGALDGDRPATSVEVPLRNAKGGLNGGQMAMIVILAIAVAAIGTALVVRKNHIAAMSLSDGSWSDVASQSQEGGDIPSGPIRGVSQTQAVI